MNKPINEIDTYNLTVRINRIVMEAYKRRSRQLPSNLSEIVDTLKGDLLKYMPSVSIETIDEAVTFEVLHDDKAQLSPAFIFAAIRKHYQQPAEARNEDKDELYLWKQRLRYFEDRNLGGSQWADECRWWIERITKGDDEGETIRLLDICAEWVAKSDEQKHAFTVQTKDGIVVELPAFNTRREYGYLKMRGQLTDETLAHHFDQAISDINADRLASRHPRLTRDEARVNPDVVARCKRLAVIDWLRACNTRNTTPSAILTPLAEELSYFDYRRTR